MHFTSVCLYIMWQPFMSKKKYPEGLLYFHQKLLPFTKFAYSSFNQDVSQGPCHKSKFPVLYMKSLPAGVITVSYAKSTITVKPFVTAVANF